MTYLLQISLEGKERPPAELRRRKPLFCLLPRVAPPSPAAPSSRERSVARRPGAPTTIRPIASQSPRKVRRPALAGAPVPGQSSTVSTVKGVRAGGRARALIVLV